MGQFECIKLDDVNKISVIKFVDDKVMDPSRIEQLGKELMSLTDGIQQKNLLINFENVHNGQE